MNTRARPRPKAILIMGPPGAGKGTQADLIANHLGFVHFNIGGYFRKMVAEKNPMMTIDLVEDLFEGDILDPHKFLSIVEKHIQEVAKSSDGIVFSGQPRSSLEAFGDEDLKGFVDFIEELSGEGDVIFFRLNVPEDVTIERNAKRGRTDDAPEIIEHRLQEYKEKTIPMIKELKKRGFSVIDIDGTPSKEEVFENIKKYIT